MEAAAAPDAPDAARPITVRLKGINFQHLFTNCCLKRTLHKIMNILLYVILVRCNMDDLINYQRFRGSRNVINAENAIIEEISADIRTGTGFVTISYGVMGEYCMMHMELVTLIVSSDTIIRDQFGQNMTVKDLREGMRVDAEFSANMTRSIPPQARAFRITVINQINTDITEGRVLDVDTNNGFLLTGRPNDIYSQMRFVITDATVIRNRRGRRIRLRDIRPGDFVVVEHATFQTMSIPPQTTAFDVQVM